MIKIPSSIKGPRFALQANLGIFYQQPKKCVGGPTWLEEGKTPSSVTGLTGFVMGGLGEVTSWDVVMADSRVSERSITPPPWGPESGTFLCIIPFS